VGGFGGDRVRRPDVPRLFPSDSEPRCTREKGTGMAGITLDEMEHRAGFMKSKKPDQVTLLPDPPRAHRHLVLISTDDHLVEPPQMFEGRLPRRFADAGPRVVDNTGGGQAWLYDGKLNPQIGLAA